MIDGRCGNSGFFYLYGTRGDDVNIIDIELPRINVILYFGPFLCPSGDHANLQRAEFAMGLNT